MFAFLRDTGALISIQLFRYLKKVIFLEITFFLLKWLWVRYWGGDRGIRAGGEEGGARPDAKEKGLRADKVYYIHLCRFPLFLYILSDLFFLIELTRMRMTFFYIRS